MSDILGSNWKDKIWNGNGNTGAAKKKVNETSKKLLDYVKHYIVTFVLTTPKMPEWTNDTVRFGYLVIVVFSVALQGEEWPLQRVVLERLAFEEEEGIKPVSADLLTLSGICD